MQPNSPNKESDFPTIKSDSPTKEPNSPIKESDFPTIKSDSPTKEPNSPNKKSDSPTKEPNSPDKKSDSPTKEPNSPIKESDFPTIKSDSPTKEPNSPIKESDFPTIKSDSSTKEPNSPNKKSDSPTKEPNSPIKESDSPTKEPNSPTKESDSPTKKSDSLTKEPNSPTKESDAPTEESNCLTEKSNFLNETAEKFSAHLYMNLSRNEINNVIISPAGIEHVLYLLASSSWSQVAKELKTSLGIMHPRFNRRNQFKDFIDNLNVDNNGILKVLTGFFINENTKVKYEFRLFAERFFGSKVENLDFFNKSRAAGSINSWIKENTNNNIDNVINYENLDNSTSMIITNVVLFQGQWKSKFPIEKTVNKNFFTNNEILSVPMMTMESVFNFGKLSKLEASFIELPFVDERFSMLIVVPDKINGLNDLENNLQKLSLKQLKKYGNETYISLTLPKFKVETTTSMKKVLREMGIKTMFLKSEIDYFNRISETKIHVSDFVQKTYFEVNEEGTVTSNVTNAPGVPE
ncbi:serine protease inhibitor 3/4-like [Leptopilina boulardi]|uniref:serine protease inhibitor 3/4-like n=1 Tax=Leptopilina boulardi TaxID=63433 RepID=UPI0021F641BF|nr:serine protease inhibitor 3/4-like [Leptopilina boulardi]